MTENGSSEMPESLLKAIGDMRSDGPEADAAARMAASLASKIGVPVAGQPPPATDLTGSAATAGKGIALKVGLAVGIIVTGAVVSRWAPYGAPPREDQAVSTTPMTSLATPTAKPDDMAVSPEAQHEPPPPAPSGRLRPEHRSHVRRVGPAAPSGSSASSGNVVPTNVLPSPDAALLVEARRTLSASPARSLALTEQHQHRFPTSPLGQEREVVAIEALVRLGRTAEARARADRFRTSYPSSVHQRTLDALLPREGP